MFVRNARRARTGRPRRRQLGTAAVELALLLPTVAFMMFLVAEAGRALYQYNTLCKAVRNAGQYLARHGMQVGTGVLAPSAAQEAAARNLVVYGSPVAGTALLPGLEDDHVTLAYLRLRGSSTDNAVTVTATYSYQPLFGALASGFTQGSNPLAGASMVASIRMRGL